MPRVRESEELARFERIVMPHLSAGYNLARWLTRNDHDAEDIVQEAYVRALRAFDRYRGGDPRAWVLTIVRNTCYTWLRANRPADHAMQTPESDDGGPIAADPGTEPEVRFLQSVDRQLLREAIDSLPPEFREAFVLREIEGLSYKEIADVADLPLGTVMSRLARARQHLQQWLRQRVKEGAS